VPEMPLEGGLVEFVTADGVHLRFCVPMGYPSGTFVNVRYTPMPKPEADEVANNAACSQQLQTVEAKIVHAIDKGCGLPILPQQLPKWDGSWHWIRYENDEVSRVTRCDAAELLMESFKKGGYSLKRGSAPLETVKYTSLKKMIKGTRILSCSEMLPELGKDPQRKMKLEHVQGFTPMEIAATMVVEGFKPACVNAASAYHLGGGFRTGGRHALEEAFCNQTTLYASLERAQDLWDIGEKAGIYRRLVGRSPQQLLAQHCEKTYSSENYHQHIPTDGCIVSPMVEIFRGNSDQGYFVYDKTVTMTAVISVAMYNKNSRMKDSPLDAPRDKHKYEEGLRKKLTATVLGAALSQADAIIIPDIGSGVFHNDPKIVGRICGEVLSAYRSYFRRVVFTGSTEFYTAASEAFRKLSTRIFARGDVTKRGSVAPADAQASVSVENRSHSKKRFKNTIFPEVALLEACEKTHKMQFIHERPEKETVAI